MSLAVTLQDSNDRNLKFLSVFKCCSPVFVIRELETFNEIKPVSPEISSNVVSVRLQFCDKFKHVREESSLIFLAPSSANSPPHISSDLRFLKFLK
uniref:Uncharacterized protein n=1 Tax=Lotus japonicus TaxID=34305 RepID=I3T7Z5_LOTJA|nr:unknown [Lotus japonicus]